MEAVPANETPPSLSKSFNECIRLFRTFLLALHDENCRVVQLKQVDLTEISDQCGRAKIWGDQMRADLPERARGSLADTLRHDNDLKGLVEAIFMRLGGLLRQATFIAEKKYDPVLGSDHDSISSVSADDSDTGSDSGSDGDDQPRHNRMPKIRLLVQQITDQIRSLYDLSSLLRRPRIADKYIRSVSSKSHTAASDTLPLMVSFSKLDESHAIEKILQWRGLNKSGQSLSCENEASAEERHSLATDEVGDILWYCQRLARANTRRREQLQHWADHPYVSTQDKVTSSQTLPVLVKPPVKASEIKEELGSQASTLKPPSFKFPPAGPKSTVSKQSFSTAAVSDVHDTKTNARPRTVYAPTNVGQGRSNAVPDPPKTDGKATFPCPYCGITLDSSEMQMRQSWKRHVFRDLRPYICTFEHCQNPDKLYVSRHEWIYHELQIHRRKYVCKECPKTSSSRTEISAHVQEHYGESISPAQLGVILDLCDQQDDGMNGEKEECLVCGEELSFLALQGHLAMHMEDMALFILPNTQEDQDLGGTNDSVQAEKLSHSRSQASSLGFSAPGDYVQNPADFSKLLTSEEAGFSSKFTHWKVTDDPEVASLKTLVKQLEDQDGKVRHAAVKALGSQTALPYEITEAVGARLECRDRNGRTVLSLAAGNGHEVTFERLLEKGADFESKDNYSHTILHWATLGGNEAIVRMLLELGADFESKTKDGKSPLHFAVKHGNEAIVRMLLEFGADFNSRNDNGESPLHYAVTHGNEAIVRMLLELGADFNSRNDNGVSPLHWATMVRNEAIVRMLLQLGADFESKTKDGKSPLHFAVWNGDEAIVRMLLELGADFESKTMDGKSPLHHAAWNGNEAIARILLELGADFESKTKDGKSPLHHAAWNGNEAIVRMLLEIGADAQMKDNRGDTALSLATRNGDKATIQLLQQNVDSPASHQSSGAYHSAPHNARDVTAGISIAEIDLNSLPTLYKKIGQDWHAVFNPQRRRDLDVDLVHVLGHSFPVTSVRFSHDGMHIATSSHRTARIFDIQTGEQVRVLDHNTPNTDQSIYISSVSFSPDDHYLATGGDNGMVCLWDIESGTILAQLEGRKGEIHAIEFSPDGRSIISGASDGTVRLWDVNTRANTRTLSTGDMIVSVTFSPDMQLIASGAEDASITVWETSTGARLMRLEGPEGHRNSFLSVAFSPDGETLVSASFDQTIKMWHLGMPIQPQSTWEVKSVKILQGHTNILNSVTFTPDGNGLLSGSRDSSLQFWDTKTGMAQFRLQGHTDTIYSVAVSPRGGIFATASADGEARVWLYGPYQAEGT